LLGGIYLALLNTVKLLLSNLITYEGPERLTHLGDWYRNGPPNNPPH